MLVGKYGNQYLIKDKDKGQIVDVKNKKVFPKQPFDAAAKFGVWDKPDITYEELQEIIKSF